MNAEIKKAVDLVGAKCLAERCGKSLPAIYTYMNGTRGVPVEICWAIEQATDGRVSRKDLRPNDWRDIWPELAERVG